MKKLTYVAPELEKINLSAKEILLASVEVAANPYDDSDVEQGSGMRWA